MDDPDTYPGVIFGAMVKQAREQRGMSQSALAKPIGSIQAYVSRLENGKENPTLDRCTLIAEVLGYRFKFTMEPIEQHRTWTEPIL